MVVNGTGRTLAHHAVNVTVRPAPTHVPTAHKTQWTDGELLEQAEKQLRQELRATLEKDIVERILASQVRKLVAHERSRKGVRSEPVVDGHVAEAGAQRMPDEAPERHLGLLRPARRLIIIFAGPRGTRLVPPLRAERDDGLDVDAGGPRPELDGQQAGGGVAEAAAVEGPQRGDRRHGHGDGRDQMVEGDVVAASGRASVCQ